MAKKEASIETELDEVIQELYEKYVPSLVREYIESRMEEPEVVPKKSSKSGGRDNENSQI